jgi:hypothetical protein
MTDTTPQPDPPEDALSEGQTGSDAEAAPDRPTEDSAGHATDVHEEEAREQSGI